MDNLDIVLMTRHTTHDTFWDDIKHIGFHSLTSQWIDMSLMGLIPFVLFHLPVITIYLVLLLL
jgi:hypothetical protein